MTDQPLPPEIDTSVAHTARVYDYLVGGTNNFPADRKAAEQQAKAFGGLDKARMSVRLNRLFLGRAVRYLALEAGVRQFLDIGTGIPGPDNVHGIAQQVVPESRVVYVDNDPLVLAHAKVLLESTPAGATSYINGDLRDPESIVLRAEATLDLDEPVALMLVAILHVIPDEDDPYGRVARLLAAMPSGSYLVASHMASDLDPEQMAALARAVPTTAQYRFALRSHAEVSRFFGGLELVEPGVVPIDQWRPDPDEEQVPAQHWGAIGRKQ